MRDYGTHLHTSRADPISAHGLTHPQVFMKLIRTVNPETLAYDLCLCLYLFSFIHKETQLTNQIRVRFVRKRKNLNKQNSILHRSITDIFCQLSNYSFSRYSDTSEMSKTEMYVLGHEIFQIDIHFVTERNKKQV